MTEQNPDLRIPEPVPDPKPDEAPAPDAATTPDPTAQSGEQTFVSAGLPRIPAHFTRAQKLLAFCCPLAGFGVLRYMILHALGLPATLVCWGVLTLGILFLKRTPRIASPGATGAWRRCCTCSPCFSASATTRR